MKCRPLPHCPDCGDRTIHLTNRGIHESSSAFGQHLHDDCPATFDVGDLDAIIYKRRDRLLRIVERKKLGQGLSLSQQHIFPLLALAVDWLVRQKYLHPESGVFKVESVSPFNTGIVHRILPSLVLKYEAAQHLSGPSFYAFKTGLPLEALAL